MTFSPRLSQLNPGLIAGGFSCALAVIFVPWWNGGSENPRWIMLALGACAAAWLPAWRIEHRIGTAFLAFAALSLLWTSGPYDGIGELAKLLMMAGIFVIGGRLDDLRPVYIGLAVGFTVNSAIAIAQWYGFDGIYRLDSHYSTGLFVNKNYLAEPAAMVLVALASSGLWRWIPGVLPSVILTDARGALAGLAVAFATWLWTKSRILAVVLLATGLLADVTLLSDGIRSASMTERSVMWKATLQGLTWAGNGLGSFYGRFPSHAPDFDTLRMRPVHAHNDLLEMTYELGPGVLLFLAILGLALTGPFGAEKLLLICFLVEGCFGFPLHFPVPAAMAALAAGHLCRLRHPICGGAIIRRAAIRIRLGAQRQSFGGTKPA